MSEWFKGMWMRREQGNEAGFKFLSSLFFDIPSVEINSVFTIKTALREEYFSRGGRFCMNDSVKAWTGPIVEASATHLRADVTLAYHTVRISSCNEGIFPPAQRMNLQIIKVSDSEAALGNSPMKRLGRYDPKSDATSFDVVMDLDPVSPFEAFNPVPVEASWSSLFPAR